VANVTSLIPEWEIGYTGGNVGGLLEAMLHPVGKFGKFLTVLLSLSMAGNISATFYSISLNIQIVIPALVIVPRYIFSLVATAMYVFLFSFFISCFLIRSWLFSVVPISIVGAHRFYDALVNFLGLIGYWASAYVAIIMLEHLCFRQNNPSLYDLKAWDVPKKLPSGLAAVAAGVSCFGVVIPSMEQVWFTGPIAKTTGDIGFEVAFGVAAVLYLPFRWLEIRWRGFV